jgi:uncharacterized alpha-E superfamily protein
VLSRAAESIFWMERYRERAENTARAVDCSVHLSLDAAADRESPWGPVVEASGDEALYEELYGEMSEKGAMQFLTFEEQNPNSILSCLSKARDNARSVRDAIATDMWEELNTAYLYMRGAAEDPAGRPSPREIYTRVKRHSHVFEGMARATMLRGEAWHFARLGGMLERADKTSRLLDMKYFLLLPSVEDVGAPYDSLQWTALLDAVGALEFYRKKYGQVLHSQVVDFLVLNPNFPRSILYCLQEAEESLRALTGTPFSQPGSEPERLLGRLRSELGYLHVEDVLKQGTHEFLNDVQIRLDEINGAISNRYFLPQTQHFILTHDQ